MFLPWFQISWVRRRDWHILTSGMFTYTNDERFTVLHAEGSDDWTLQIKYVQKRDNGTYECQVSVKQLVGLVFSPTIKSLTLPLPPPYRPPSRIDCFGRPINAACRRNNIITRARRRGRAATWRRVVGTRVGGG